MVQGVSFRRLLDASGVWSKLSPSQKEFSRSTAQHHSTCKPSSIFTHITSSPPHIYHSQALPCMGYSVVLFFALQVLVQVAVLEGHEQMVSDLDWAPKADQILSCSYDRNAFVWTRSQTSAATATPKAPPSGAAAGLQSPGAGIQRLRAASPGSSLGAGARALRPGHSTGDNCVSSSLTSVWEKQMVITRLTKGALCVRWSPSETKVRFAPATPTNTDTFITIIVIITNTAKANQTLGPASSLRSFPVWQLCRWCCQAPAGSSVMECLQAHPPVLCPWANEHHIQAIGLPRPLSGIHSYRDFLTARQHYLSRQLQLFQPPTPPQL